MKKIFFLCAVALASVAANAQQVMTCSAAAAAATALPATDGKGTLDDTNSIDVILTGYVTNTNGTISRGQQTFYMDDVQGQAKTVQSYWGNLPAGEETPLNVGDQVTLAGRIFNFNGTTPEIKNGTVTILQRVVVHVDTTLVNVCEAIEIGEALNAGEVSDDYFDVTGVVTMAGSPNTTYHTQTIDLTCEDNGKILEGYNITLQGEEYAALGDTVRFLGRLTNYNNTKVEFNGGKAWIVAKAAVTYIPKVINVTVAEAVTAGMELANSAQSVDTFVVTGYVDSIATVYSSQYDNISFFMCDDLATPTYEFEAFRAKGGENLKVGDKVAVKGLLQHYYKAATEEKPEINLIETVSGATLEILSAEAVSNHTEALRATKAVVANQLVILKDSRRFNTLGQQIR